ncbi:hypothetical protein CTAM01_15006 [Colletotrichum tamarilloi]|uniref:Uncharacterized protein n=1 Tax=Colletotrichum tamarilloi TaxID=1209934 RepID=A0ABQ9QMT6_9PEZI|nr:uncharacterized protein CTAM01_15006 [Colletotrichum tamarilloi]KAK1478404.1 hypothetical protein CTAM01_15006 [Colletotrichum tamarilloi]
MFLGFITRRTSSSIVPDTKFVWRSVSRTYGVQSSDTLAETNKYGQFAQETPPSTRAIAHALGLLALEDVHSGSCGSSRHDATPKHHVVRTSTDTT